MGLIIRSSSIHAAGCYTTGPIAKGARVVEYTGPVLKKDEADLRYADRPITYLFGIGDGSQVIDGHGIAMFINHSCNPNCETEEIDGRVWIMAIRNIAAGEELCYDYLLYDGDEEEELPCNCGARICRGSMYSPEEIRRRQRLAQKRAAKRKPLKARKTTAPGKSGGKRSGAGKKPPSRTKNRKEPKERKRRTPAETRATKRVRQPAKKRGSGAAIRRRRGGKT